MFFSCLRIVGRVAVAVFFSTFAAVSCGAQQIVYVDGSLATGANDGTSWSDAFQGRLGLQSALANLPSGDVQVWVAEGTYAPGPAGGSRDSHFDMRDNTAIYGGFAGGETLLDQRDPAVHITILTGDLNDDDTPGQIYWNGQADNATNVVPRDRRG